MIDAIQEEIVLRKTYLDQKSIETIYFGGGTPSLLTSKEIAAILNLIDQHFTVSEHPEITLEANPDDITEERLKEWKELNINRLSIGLQSFREKDLIWMNRAHNAKESLECIKLAQKHGFHNLTIDLIYGLPDLSLEEWESQINTAISLKIPHISAYCLTVEEKTALHHWVKKGKIEPSNEDQQSDQFLKLLNILERSGYEQYEISNFCLPNFESKHNSNYWKGEWYLGIGPSAHSFNGASRTWNISNNTQYIKGIETGKPLAETEVLSKADQFNEAILTGLRTSYGVHLDKLWKEGVQNTQFQSQLTNFIQKGWASKSDNHLVLTKEGKLRADYIASELFID